MKKVFFLACVGMAFVCCSFGGENFSNLRDFINDSRIDIFSERKTLIFCARDYHADMVKHILDKLFKEKYGDKYDEKLVKKITGKADDPQMLTDRFRLEREPNIAITVELLTTGIDVPKICNLLYLRFLRSPVLFEQMLGRATRLCPAIGKYSFSVFDAVGVVEYMDKLIPGVKSFKYHNADLNLDDIINILTDDKKRQEAMSKPSDIDLNGKVSTNYAKDLVLIFARRVGNLIARAKAKEKEKRFCEQENNGIDKRSSGKGLHDQVDQQSEQKNRTLRSCIQFHSSRFQSVHAYLPKNERGTVRTDNASKCLNIQCRMSKVTH